MSITEETGSIFDSGAECLVNPVNCIGVMGVGLAKQFKDRYPKNFESYNNTCFKKELVPGRIHVFRENDVNIINFPTKAHWADPSRLEAVEMTLVALGYWMVEHQPKSVAIPAVGCGWGGLSWLDVKPMIETLFGPSETNVIVYAPQGNIVTKDKVKKEKLTRNQRKNERKRLNA